jgi:queuine/archaeosine tRNA-ribosyltransferase
MYKYVPQCQPSIGKQLSEGDFTIGPDNLKATWWEKDSIFYHDSLLISAFYGIELDNCRKALNIPKDVLFIGDSGGYQILTMKVNISPLRVIQWFNRNEVDVGFTLDLPVRLDDSDEIFDKKMTKSNTNADLMAENRNDLKRLYLVVHGNSLDKMEKWYQNGVKEHDWDGICMAKRSPTVMTTARILAFGISKGIKNMHVLKATSWDDLCLLYYFSDRFDLLTSDSSSYSYGARFREYINPLSGQTIFMGERFAGRNGGLKTLPCRCPACSTTDLDELNGNKKDIGTLINVHNLWTQLDWAYKLNAIKDDKGLLLKMMTPKAIEGVKLVEEINTKKATLSDWI